MASFQGGFGGGDRKCCTKAHSVPPLKGMLCIPLTVFRGLGWGIDFQAQRSHAFSGFTRFLVKC
jgi:hypothetical protein